MDAVAELVRPAEIIGAQLGLVLGGKVVEAYDEEGIIYSLETLPISRVRGEHFAEAAPDFAVFGGEYTNGGAGDLVLEDFVRIRADGLEIEEDLPLGQHWPVLGVEHVKVVCTPIGPSVNWARRRRTIGKEGNTHRTGRGG